MTFLWRETRLMGLFQREVTGKMCSRWECSPSQDIPKTIICMKESYMASIERKSSLQVYHHRSFDTAHELGHTHTRRTT